MSAARPARWAAGLLVGPTASGKTEVVHELARRAGAAILSADSMLVYRGMDIGTAKPNAAERAEFSYGGLDLADPDEAFSVGDWLSAARAFADRCATAGRPLLVAGGTGLYVRCLLLGLARELAPAPEHRAQAAAIAAAGGLPALQAWLRARAPARWAALADPANPRRVQRAVEQALAGLPEPPRGHALAILPPVVGLRRAPADLAERIARRTDDMFARGLPEEARRLREQFPGWTAAARRAIGYMEALDGLDGRMDPTAAPARTTLRTRQYAKRQMTFFRTQLRVDWVEATGRTAADIADEVAARWKDYGSIRLAE